LLRIISLARATTFSNKTLADPEESAAGSAARRGVAPGAGRLCGRVFGQGLGAAALRQGITRASFDQERRCDHIAGMSIFGSDFLLFLRTFFSVLLLSSILSAKRSKMHKLLLSIKYSKNKEEKIAM